MDSLMYNATVSLPHVAVTEPSLASIQTTSVTSVVRKIEYAPEVTANGITQESKQSVEQCTATSVPSANFAIRATSESIQQEQVVATTGPNVNFASGEIVPAQECIVSVPEASLSQQLEDSTPATITPPPEQDYYFGIVDEGCCAYCCLCTMQCLTYYQNTWDMIHSQYALPIWMLLLALPLSAGYMGSIYMYSCPACHSLPMLNYLIGICLMAELSFRICIIIRIMTMTEGESWGSKLYLLLLASTFLTVVFFVSEAMLFWQMVSSTQRGSPQYCNPHFVTYSFWWNCVMSVVMVPIFLFPS